MHKLLFLVGAATLVTVSAASANPRSLPFTYTSDQNAAGDVEIEQFVDVAPRKALTASSSSGAGEWFMPAAFQTEIEIGITDRLELGLYMTFVPAPSDGYEGYGFFPGVGNGLKQRLRYALATPGEWPLDVSLYGELTENDREIELEAKVILQRRIGELRIAANLSSEYEMYFNGQREWVLNPSAGVTYEVTPNFHLGIDSWLRAEYPTNPEPASRTFGLGPHVYAGPAVMMNFGKLWWAVGAYLRVTELSHELLLGEPYGPLYVRSMVGYDL